MAMKHSEFLEFTIKSAKELIAGSPQITPEKFMVVVLRMLKNENTVREHRNELVPMLPLLNMSGFSIDAVCEQLVAFIQAPQAEPYAGMIHMQKVLLSVELAAKQAEYGSIDCDMVQVGILNNPTDKIKELLPVDALLAQLQASTPDQQLKQPQTSNPGEVVATFGKPAAGGQPMTTAAPSAPVSSGNPKMDISALTAKVKQVQDFLLDRIYGQDNAVSVFTTGYFQAELLDMTDKKRVRPRATFLLAGPPGVGKTFLAESAAEALGLPFMRYDMSEYSDHQAGIEFCGADKAYSNAKPGNVTGFVEKNPKCLLLFDEIEKAHLNVIHLFLQMLDAGRLRDNYTDTEVSFRDAIIIFTTNAGKQLYDNAESGDFSGLSRKVILNALKKDINPTTGAPFFPAAICSRFASGNVVMLNHIAAHNLREIAKREVCRHATNFENEIGIKVEIDEQVYTTLLFAEGGTADARTIRSRSEIFFDDELFELFRMIAADEKVGRIEDLESIKVELELPTNDPELSVLFGSPDRQKIMVYAAADTTETCRAKYGECDFLNAQDIGTANGLFSNNDIHFIILDITHGARGEQNYLNIEDVDSAARDFLWYIRASHRDVPVYLLEKPTRTFNAEERISFLRMGVRGIVTLDDSFAETVSTISEQLHQQNSMNSLAKTNKVVSYQTAQYLTDGGKVAHIKLFDFEMSVAVDAEDSKNILSNVSKPNVRFDQVIGAKDAKEELQYFVQYLKNPKKYMGTGVRPPKGVLLYGPPGTGKTMLAKAMASESDVTFITAEGNQFLKRYVGEGPETVHELFRTARKYAPSILFIDEIDAIAKERTGSDNAVGEETLTALLAEMDGFKNDPSKPVFVLAATNFEVEPGSSKSLDAALMRRFDRRVFIDLPDRDDRMRYMRMKLSSHKAFDVSEEKLENIAVRSTGMSLALLESVFELALRSSIRDGSCKVTDKVLDEAFETFNHGEEKEWNEAHLERVARHESGHAFLCWQSGETPSYLTVVARGNHGGYMRHDDNSGKSIYTREELLAKIRTSLGGRAAELVYYGPEDGVSTGASGDLQSATYYAQQILCTFGMDADFGLAVVDPKAMQIGSIAPDVRLEVNKILAREMEKSVQLIEQNKAAVDALVDVLKVKNHMTGPEINELLKSVCGQNS